jgi:hypothetical protein
MTRELGLRIALGYLAAMNALIGIWAQFFPQSFFDDFPGAGDAWVAVDGPYNEHLVRDVGALSLALFVVLAAAAIGLKKSVVIVASLASLVAGVPHLIYHVRHTDGLDGMSLVASLGGLFVAVVLPLAIIYVITRPDRIFSHR